MIKINLPRSDPFTEPGSVLSAVSGELIKRFMTAQGAMQFGCCFIRFQLGALRYRLYVGKDTGERERVTCAAKCSGIRKLVGCLD